MRQSKRLPDFEIDYDKLLEEGSVPPGEYLVLGEGCYTLGRTLGTVFRLVDFTDLNTEYHLIGEKADQLIFSRKDYLRTKMYKSE